jgi:hypothetical protein
VSGPSYLWITHNSTRSRRSHARPPLLLPCSLLLLPCSLLLPCPPPNAHRHYCAEGDCMWCAGGLMVEHALVVPHIQRIDGTQDGVMGLAKALVVRLLVEAAERARQV